MDMDTNINQPTSDSKLCKKCQVLKPLSEFRKQASSPDGHKYRCKICDSAAAKERYESKKEVIKTKVKDWQVKNRDKVYSYVKKFREKKKASDKSV